MNAHAASVEDCVSESAYRGNDGRLAHSNHGFAFIFIIDQRHEFGHLGSAAAACCHETDFPPPFTLPFAKVISSGLASPSSGAIFSAIAILALMAASLTEGDREAEVVEPPEALAPPSLELPIFSTISFS